MTPPGPVSLPLLRSPPFPGIPIAVAAVCPGSGAEPGPLAAGRVDDVLAVVRAARVGGAFWAAPSGGSASVVVRPGATRARAEALAGPDALWLAPERRAGPGGKEVDPWSLLGPDRTLVAHGDDEWIAVATLAGARVRLLSPGRFALPEDDEVARRVRIARDLLGWRYRDPFADAPCSVERAVELLGLWRGIVDANRPIRAAAGMAWWKRAEMRRFLWAPRPAPLAFRWPGAAVQLAAAAGGSVAAWPSRFPAGAVGAAARAGVPLVRVEDGFVRSAGLGADLVPPLSVTVDRLGIHYDPSRPSELEALLASAAFPLALLERARALRAAIVDAGLGKYGGSDRARPAAALPARVPGRRLVLVPGQVEDDRSVLLGGAGVGGNLGLLARVRAAEPDAEIWYRPHPDVDAGHRRGGPDDAAALAHVDRVVRVGGLADVLPVVDAVHVLTSLAGFEALLRGVAVTCHGVPFYAGWGLTRDLGPVPVRRGRTLTLDALVAATLILYPRYLDPATGLPCPPEVLVARIATGAAPRADPAVRLRRLQGRLLRRWRR